MNKFSHKSGFTIIEVVLVLAIAGLIFLMVFLALPALQRSQRDTQRRDDLSGFSTQITNYQANNRGKLPQSFTAWNDFLKNYMKQDGVNGEFVDPDGVEYKIAASCANATTPFSTKCSDDLSLSDDSSTYTYNPNSNFNHYIYIIYGGKCDGEKVVKATGSSTRQVAFLYKLEGGGTFCGSNS